MLGAKNETGSTFCLEISQVSWDYVLKDQLQLGMGARWGAGNRMIEAVPDAGAQQSVSLAFVRALESSFRSYGALLLNNGIGARTILAAVKRALIRSAEDGLSTRGRPLTAARIAAFTGLTQAELSQGAGVGPPMGIPKAASTAAVVLHLWFTNSKYCSPFTAEPMPLLFANRSGPSFSSLVRDAQAGDPHESLQELLDAGAVSSAVSDADNQTYFKPKQRAFFYPIQTEDTARYIGESLTNLLWSLTHNASTEDHADRVVNRRAFSDYKISREAAGAFRTFLDQRVSTLLEQASDWLSKQPDDPAGEKIGLQIFQYAVPSRNPEDSLTNTPPQNISPKEPKNAVTLNH